MELTVSLVCCLLVPTLWVVHSFYKSRQLSHIPTVGGSSWPLLGGFRSVRGARKSIREGYTKHRGQFFKIPLLGFWNVFISDGPLRDELAKLDNEHASFMEAADLQLSMRVTGAAPTVMDPYHIPYIRFDLTRNLKLALPDLLDEIKAAYSDYLPSMIGEWTKIHAQDTFLKVVSRSTNRIFIGLPLCRNPEFMKLSMKYAHDVAIAGVFISLFPGFLKPLAAAAFSSVRKTQKQGMQLLAPLIQQRREENAAGVRHDSDKMQDLISYALAVTDCDPVRASDFMLTRQIFTMNFASIHTTESVFLHTLYYLAANPKYIQPLRDEVEAAIAEEGMTKNALEEMHKIDSFVKESMRHSSFNGGAVMRVMMKDYTFSDGTHVPAGTLISAPTEPVHYDPALWDAPDEFRPFRFSDMREKAGEGTKHQFATIRPEFFPWGGGRQACPGRFFAAMELKAILALLVLDFDVRTEVEGVRPPNEFITTSNIPCPTAHILMRRRAKPAV